MPPKIIFKNLPISRDRVNLDKTKPDTIPTITYPRISPFVTLSRKRKVTNAAMQEYAMSCKKIAIAEKLTVSLKDFIKSYKTQSSIPSTNERENDRSCKELFISHIRSI